MKILVSVIVPVYNEEKYLDSCLGSLENQTYKDKEIIVVDDGSKDKSLLIAKKHKIRLLETAHKGPGNARNIGASKAKGEILIFADADMYFYKDYIVNLIKPIVEKKTPGTFTKEEFVANPDNIWSRCWNINNGLFSNRRLPADYPQTENAFRAILKDVFLTNKGFEVDEGYTDDSSFSRRSNIKALKADGAICYHYNPSSLVEVFYSARWIGRSKKFESTIYNFFRFSPINSFRVGLKYLLKGAPPQIFLFKLIYDLGIFAGIFFKGEKTFK
ncbi:MAG: glycosyltransferase family 2 protein [Candidatus Levybacteria bacterium]|nr:glycosyltransferase family 2 protein [Candidatus Levybacteria bacterium]